MLKDTLSVELPPGTVLEAPLTYLPASSPGRRAYRRERWSRRADELLAPVAVASAVGRWSPDAVGARLIEAMLTIDRLPMARGPAPVKSLWPAINRRGATAPKRAMNMEQWAEALQDAASVEALRDKQKWAFGHAKATPSPAEITRAYEAMRWPLRFLQAHEGMARVLRTWVVAKARGRAGGNDDLKRLCRKKGWAYSTFRRKRAAALAIIADGLNKAGEAVT